MMTLAQLLISSFLNASSKRCHISHIRSELDDVSGDKVSKVMEVTTPVMNQWTLTQGDVQLCN